MMQFSSLLATASMLGMSAAIPLTSISSLESRQAPSCPGTGHKAFTPFLRTIDNSSTDPQFFHVQNNSFTTLSIKQVMTFTDLPATASNYYLQWAQTPQTQDFKAVGGGTVAVYTLDDTKLPPTDAENPVTLTEEVVDAAIDVTIGPHGTGRIGSAAFGGWPDSVGTREHLVGSVNVTTGRPRLSFRLTLQEFGEVTLRQDATNGWFLKYDC